MFTISASGTRCTARKWKPAASSELLPFAVAKITLALVSNKLPKNQFTLITGKIDGQTRPRPSLNPTDPESEDREWIAQIWQRIIATALGQPAEKLAFEKIPAVGRITVSSPAVIRPLANLNLGKPYPDQIKPFNFLLSCHVKPLGGPLGADPERFHLIGPYEGDSRKWLSASGSTSTPATLPHYDNGSSRQPRRRRVKPGDVATEYEFHPESKCAGQMKHVTNKQLVATPHIRVEQIKYIGKIEQPGRRCVGLASQCLHQPSRPRRDGWQTNSASSATSRLTSCRILHRKIVPPRTHYLRAGRNRPHARNEEMLSVIVKQLGSNG